MVSGVWRYSLKDFPVHTLNKPPLSTIAHCFKQEGVGEVVRIDVAKGASQFDVFVINPERRMPRPSYKVLGETRITISAEVTEPLPVKEGWVSCNVTWENHWQFRLYPTPTVCYPEAMAAPGQPCPYAILLAVSRPNPDIAKRERRTDVTDLGPRWDAPYISTAGLGMYTWFEFIQYHGVEWGAQLWELGDNPTQMQDVTTLDCECSIMLNECQDIPLLRAVLGHIFNRLRSVPGITSKSEYEWVYHGPCSPQNARIALKALDDFQRLSSIVHQM